MCISTAEFSKYSQNTFLTIYLLHDAFYLQIFMQLMDLIFHRERFRKEAGRHTISAVGDEESDNSDIYYMSVSNAGSDLGVSEYGYTQ